MKLMKVALTLALSFVVQNAFAQEETTTTTTNPDGSTVTQTTEDRSDSPNKGGIFIEPSLRYEKLEGDVDLGLGSAGVDMSGAGIGARVGFHVYDSMFLAFEGTYSQLEAKEGETGYKADGSAHSYGPVVGFQTPWAGIRVWGTYLMNGQFDPGSNRGVDLKFKDLQGYRVGLGFRVAKVGISVEYQDAKYDSLEIQAGNGFTTDRLKLQHTGWIGNVNFPISL